MSKKLFITCPNCDHKRNLTPLEISQGKASTDFCSDWCKADSKRREKDGTKKGKTPTFNREKYDIGNKEITTIKPIKQDE